MKKKEWERRQPLDEVGVRMLGEALHIRACANRDRAIEKANLRQSAKEPVNIFEWPDGQEHYSREAKELWSRCNLLRVQLNGLEAFKDTSLRARHVRAKDFRFRWDHLRDHPILVGYIDDEQSYVSKNWDRETPISESGESALVAALEEIFHSELALLLGPNPEETPTLRTKKDLLFFMLVWKLCEAENGPGHPTGRRCDDGAVAAAELARQLIARAADGGNPITKEEAIRQALRDFEIVNSEEYASHPDQKSVIVSNAASAAGPEGGAIKAVRKLLTEMDKDLSLNRS